MVRFRRWAATRWRWAPARLLAGAAVVALVAAGCGGDAEERPDSADPSPTESMAGDMADDMDEGMGDATAAPDSAAAGVPEALEFTARTVDGDEFDAATLTGDPVVFWFWAAWCSKCAAAASDLAAVQADYDGQVHMVGVAGLGSGDGAMRDFVDRHQLGGFPHLADDEGTVWNRFGVTSQEYVVVLDAEGTVVQSGQVRASDLRDHLDSLVS